VERVKGVHKDYNSKVLFPFKLLLQVFRGLLMAFIDTVRVRGFFWFVEVRLAKKVKNYCVRGLRKFHIRASN
jgi:hypothetical protein